MAKSRARISILSEVISYINENSWTSCYSDSFPKVGDLVAMTSAPATKYYLAWLRDISPNNGWPKYLLESVDDGEMCWWTNIGLRYYNREQISNRPEWKWDDEQYAFNDRWLKVCRRNGAYIVLPCQPTFLDDGSVLLDVRIRFSLSNYRNPITFPNWRKVTMKMMDEYYKKSEKEYKSKTHLTPAAPAETMEIVT